MKISFYDIKNKQSIEIELQSIKKITYKRETSKGMRYSYSLKGTTADGRIVSKFVNKTVYDSTAVPEVE